MNKTELIYTVAEKAELSKKDGREGSKGFHRCSIWEELGKLRKN